MHQSRTNPRLSGRVRPQPITRASFKPVLFLPGFPRCPTCGAEAHELTFSPAVDSEETRVLTDFAWRCPNGHQFATAMPDVPLVTWRRLTERPYA
jgi:hypothetical protein